MLTQVEQGASDRPVTGAAAYGAGLSPLQLAILETITYRDLFDFPVTAAEIHRCLHEQQCSAETVQRALQDDAFLQDYLSQCDGYYALKGRDELFALRRERDAEAQRLWAQARAYGDRLASLPFVQMVAVTGSLAVDNPGRDADIDFMMVTRGGRLWTVRLLAKLLQYIDAKFGSGRLCVNYLVSERALELEQAGLYVAYELAQMVPVYGAATYSDLRARNAWCDALLPNADGPPTIRHQSRVRRPRLRRIAERLLDTRLGDLLERWESRRKLHKYNDTEFLLGRSTLARPESTGHRRNVRETIEAAFADRMKGPRSARRNLRILFAQAYHLHLDPKLWREMRPFPPLGSLYAAAVARRQGHDVRVHDSMLTVSNAEWRAALNVNAPDVVVLYEDNFNYLTKMCLLNMRDAACSMIRDARERGATVIVCSSDGADAPDVYLDAGADYIVVGEGEQTLDELLSFVNGGAGHEPGRIAGLAFRDNEGQLVHTGRRPVMRHIDDLPLPAWDLVDLGRYQEIWSRRHGRFSLNLVTTRGCPYHCNWCAKPIWGQRYNARTPQNVVEEITWLRELADFDDIWFMDDIFGLKPGWTRRFADELEAAGLSIRFKCLSRPDLLLRDGETEALARAGCDIVWMGAESGSQKVLDAMEKGTTVEAIHGACASLRANGIRVGLFIQFGYPGETRADIGKTLTLIREIMPDQLGISVSYPLPGTPFYDRVQSELGGTRHWQHSDDLAMLFRGPFNTAFYRALHAFVHSDMMLRKAWRARRPLVLGYALARRTWFATIMAIASRMPHRGINELPVALTPDAAAEPSSQPGD